MTEQLGPIEAAVADHVTAVWWDEGISEPPELAMSQNLQLLHLARVLDDGGQAEQHFEAAAELLRCLRELHCGSGHLTLLPDDPA